MFEWTRNAGPGPNRRRSRRVGGGEVREQADCASRARALAQHARPTRCGSRVFSWPRRPYLGAVRAAPPFAGHLADVEALGVARLDSLPIALATKGWSVAPLPVGPGRRSSRWRCSDRWPVSSWPNLRPGLDCPPETTLPRSPATRAIRGWATRGGESNCSDHSGLDRLLA